MLSSNIVRLRKKKGLTQIEFAKALGVSQSAVSHWETGRSFPETPQLFQLAEFFCVSIDDLIGDDDLLPPTPQDTATVYVLDGQPTRGLRDDLSESQDEDIDVLIAAYKRMSSEKKKHFKALALAIADEERKGE